MKRSVYVFITALLLGASGCGQFEAASRDASTTVESSLSAPAPEPEPTPAPTPLPPVQSPVSPTFLVGVPPEQKTFQDYRGISPTGSPLSYSATNKIVKVRVDNTVIDGYDFSDASISVEANNVTIKNSKFNAVSGSFTIRQINGKSGLVVDHCSFDGMKLDNHLAAFIFAGSGKVTITNNEFFDSPSDAVNLTHGVVDRNYFHGAAYGTGAHADAISIDGNTGPVAVTNNYIDSRKRIDAPSGTTSAIAVGNYYGDVTDTLISNNVLLGGAYTIYVQDFGTFKAENIRVNNNRVGSSQWGDLYPNRRPTTMIYQNNVPANVTDPGPAGGATGVRPE